MSPDEREHKLKWSQHQLQENSKANMRFSTSWNVASFVLIMSWLFKKCTPAIRWETDTKYKCRGQNGITHGINFIHQGICRELVSRAAPSCWKKPAEVFWEYPTGRRPQFRPRTCCWDYIYTIWPGNFSGSQRRSWKMLWIDRLAMMLLWG